MIADVVAPSCSPTDPDLTPEFAPCVDKLPGPPQNVQVEPIDSHSVRVKWDPPVKNPHTVEVYR